MPRSPHKPSIDIIDSSHQPSLSLGDLPYSVIATLELDEPAHLQDDQRPLSKRLREIITRQGISHYDLVIRMKWTRINKSLRRLDAALRGKSKDVAMIRRAYECLGVSPEAFEEILKEEKAFVALRHREANRRSAHSAFRMLGPHLTAILTSEARANRPRITAPYRYRSARVPYEIVGETIVPFTDEQVAQAIMDDATWLPAVTKPYVEAYIYHRMPEEACVIDVHGKILAAGDWRYSRDGNVAAWLTMGGHSLHMIEGLV